MLLRTISPAFSTPLFLRPLKNSRTALCQPLYSIHASTPLPKPTTQTVATPPRTRSPSRNSTNLRLLYDGACPLCVREVNFLRRRSQISTDPTKSISFVDIADDDYDAEKNAGIGFERAMGRIHAIVEGGDGKNEKVISGVEVFRKSYEAVGLGWIYAPTKVWGLGKVIEGIYDLWARGRLWMTGRPGLDVVVRERDERIKNRCRMDSN